MLFLLYPSCLNWIFFSFFRVPERMNLGNNFIKCIRPIYTSQKALVIVNGELTKPCETQLDTDDEYVILNFVKI